MHSSSTNFSLSLSLSLTFEETHPLSLKGTKNHTSARSQPLHTQTQQQHLHSLAPRVSRSRRRHNEVINYRTEVSNQKYKKGRTKGSARQRRKTEINMQREQWVAAQWTEWLHARPEDLGSSQVVGNFDWTLIGWKDSKRGRKSTIY